METNTVAVAAAPAERPGTPWWVSLIDGVAMSVLGIVLVVASGLPMVAPSHAVHPEPPRLLDPSDRPAKARSS